MKQNTYGITQILSVRAQEFLNSPKHYSLEQTIDQRWFISFEANGSDFQTDKILTLSFSVSSENRLEILLSESICRMSIGRNVQFIEKLSFRELENFMRDENHLPVFVANEVVLAEECFKMVKISLLSGCLLVKVEKFIETFWDNKSAQKGWDELSLLEKNTQSKLIISKLNNLFPRGKMLELALAQESDISIIMNEFPIPIESIELVFQEFYRCTIDKTSFKVVAVQ